MTFRGHLYSGNGKAHNQAERFTRRDPSRRDDAPTHNATGADSEGEAPLDPFLMDFGASVSVHEDQIRHVRGGTVEIEERITKTNSDLKKEEMVNRQLKQDLVHCKTEKRHILQVASDQLETVQMQRNFLQGLETTLRANLVPAVVSPDRVPESTSHKAVNYGKDILPKRQQSLSQLSRQLKNDAREIKELHLQMEAWHEKLRALHGRIDSENLTAVLLEKTKEADRMEEELKLETEKCQATKAATLKKRMEAGANAQELADLTKKRDTLRRESQRKKDAVSQRIQESQESNKRKIALNEDLKTRLANADAQIQALQAAERLRKALKEANEVLEMETKSNVELVEVEKQLAIKVEASAKHLEMAQLGLVRANKLDSEARRSKQANDEEYDSKVVPGRVELSEIAERKETLAEKIKETQKSLSELEITEKDRLDSKYEAKRKSMDELKTLQEQADSIKAKQEDAETSNRESKDNWESEIKQLEELEASLRTTMATKEACIEELVETQTKRRRESLDEATSRAEEEKTKNRRLLKLLGSAEKYIAKAKDRVGQLGESLDI